MKRNLKVLLIALLVLAIAGATFAFAAANTVPDTAAGYGGKTVPGYTVSDVIYDLHAANPSLVDNIWFSISPTSGAEPAAVVRIQTAENGDWTNCTLTVDEAPAMTAVCNFPSPYLAMAEITALNVVASSTADTAAPLP
jgi:hypothetical protein